MQLFLQQQRIGAEVNIFFAGHQAVDDLVNLRMHEGFAARNRNHRGSALIDCFEAVFHGEIFFQDVGRVLNFAASGAGQIATEERLQHEHERVALASGELLAQDVGGHGPHLGYGNCHCIS